MSTDNLVDLPPINLNAGMVTFPVMPNTQPPTADDHIILLPPPATTAIQTGPFTQRCCVLGTSLLVATEIARMTTIHQMLYLEPTSTIESQITIIGEQLQLFPVIAIQRQDNRVVVLHGIRRMSLPLGSHTNGNPAYRKVLAFLGNMVYPGTPPQVVIILDTAFDDEKPWLLLSKTSMRSATPQTQVIPPPRNASTMHTTCIHLIPPSLVPFFLDNNQEHALPMFMKFRLTHDESKINMQELSAKH